MTAPAPAPAGRIAERPRPAGRVAQGGGLLRAARPTQWTKNLLVFTAPGAAGVLLQPVALGRVTVAFVVFCLASSAGYLFNDARDAPADRLHPVKAYRPIASGLVPVSVAYVTAALLMTAALTVAAAVGPVRLVGLVAAYGGLTATYTLILRRMVVLDLGAVAGCHVIRAVAGGVVTAVPLSNWYLIVVSLGSVLLVAGRREAELRLPSSSGVRPTLAVYTTSYLGSVRSIASSALIVTYCLWALTPGTFPGLTLRAASIVPFILVVLRLNLLIEQGAGAQPEQLLLRDRQLQVMLAVLVAILAAGIYGGR